MAETKNQDAETKTEGEAKEKTPRQPSDFHIFIRTADDQPWTPLPQTYSALTQDDAKKAAARDLAADGSEFQDIIVNGDGLQVAAVTVRGFKPIVVKVEPQPAKLVLK